MNNCHSSSLKKLNLDRGFFPPWWDENHLIIRGSLMVWIIPFRRWKSSPGMNSMGYEYGQILNGFHPLNSSLLGGIFTTFMYVFLWKTRCFLFFFNTYEGWKFNPKQINFLHLSGWNTGWFSTPMGLTVIHYPHAYYSSHRMSMLFHSEVYCKF